MGFVQAAMLTALAAVVLPIIAHLIFRRRSRPVDLGTLRFLKVAVRRDTRRRRLKRWVLLTLRVGCVVLLALLFARPYRAAATSSESRVAGIHPAPCSVKTTVRSGWRSIAPLKIRCHNARCANQCVSYTHTANELPHPSVGFGPALPPW